MNRDSRLFQLMSKYTCDDCNEEFETLSKKRLHDCSTGSNSQLQEEPNYDSPWAPKQDSDRELFCRTCHRIVQESNVSWEFDAGIYGWFCPGENCNGNGVGVEHSCDLIPLEKMEDPEKAREMEAEYFTVGEEVSGDSDVL